MRTNSRAIPRKIRELMAIASYETLEEPDRVALEAYLEQHPDAREEYEDFARLAARIPVDELRSPDDLLGRVRDRLDSRDRRSRFPLRAPAVAFAAVLLVAVGLALFRPTPVNAPQEAGPLSTPAPDEVAKALDEAERLADDRQFNRAFQVLRTAVESNPWDAESARATQRMADLAYENLRVYPAALQYYRELQTRHPETFLASRETNYYRLEILDEANDRGGFELLHQLDAAGERGDFDACERIVAENPGTYLASLAVETMAEIVSGGKLTDAEGRLAALERARERCGRAVASVQVQYEMAQVYDTSLQDADRARSLYRAVRDSGVTRLASRASERLQDLED